MPYTEANCSSETSEESFLKANTSGMFLSRKSSSCHRLMNRVVSLTIEARKRSYCW